MELISKWAWTLGLAGMLALLGGVSLTWAYGGMAGAPRAFLVAGAVLLLLYAFFDRETIGGAVQTRTFMHGSSSTLLVVLAGVAAVASYSLARQNDTTWDLTREKSFTLSDHSVRIVEGLDEDVQVLAFFRSGAGEQREFRSLVDRLTEHSDRLQVQWIDPLRQPRLAEENEVSNENGTVILRTADDRTQRLDVDLDEETLIQKLVLLISRSEHRICWALGHGEPDPDDEFSERGLGVAVIQLEELNYQVTRSMVPTEGLDRACDALVIVRPTVEWMPWEREALAAYLAEGGRVLMLLEPDSPPELSDELERYGMRLRQDIVLDLNPENQLMGVSDPSFVVLHGPNLLAHPITANLAAAVVLPIARSIEPLSDAEGLKVGPVLQTSRDAWGETGMDPNQMPQPDPGLELVGEVPVMAVAEVEDPGVLEVMPHDDDGGRGVPEDFSAKAGGRLVVIGDSDFIGNNSIALGNNRDLFLNSVAWLVEEEAQIGERPDAGETLAIDGLSAAFLCLVSVVFLPGAAVFLAVISWYRRRGL